jgi:hypothetical protein
MRRQSGAVRVRGMGKIAQRAADDLTLWTEFLVAGKRVYIRTHRPLGEPPRPGEKRTDPPKIEVRTLLPEAEP